MKKLPILFIIILIFLLPPWMASAFELPLLLQERYLHLKANPFNDQLFTDRLSVSAFSGDFPLVVHKREGEFSLYSGVPLFIPLFFSVGKANQVGYIDSYSTHTPVSLLSVGWKADWPSSKPNSSPGLFASWGWRSGMVSGGFSYHASENIAALYLGISGCHGAAGASVSPEEFTAALTLRTASSWSITAAVTRQWEGDSRFRLGFGFSRRDYPADELLSDSWDVKIAHRGSLQKAPENTLAALNWALGQEQFSAIEVDVQRTKDGSFVIIHDPILLRYTGDFRFISSMTYQELLSLDLGSWFSPEFSGERILHLRDIAALSRSNPDTYWLIEIKSYSWSEEDVISFLKEADTLFEDPGKIVFYTLNRRTLDLMKQHTDRPVGLQLDSRQFMLFYSDHILPLTRFEHSRSVGDADFYTIISSKYDRFSQISRAAEELEIPVIFWNFHDIMFGHIPDACTSYPLGIRGIDSGRIFPGSR